MPEQQNAEKHQNRGRACRSKRLVNGTHEPDNISETRNFKKISRASTVDRNVRPALYAESADCPCVFCLEHLVG